MIEIERDGNSIALRRSIGGHGVGSLLWPRRFEAGSTHGAHPLPLAGEGWGGGSLRNKIRGGSPHRLALLGTLPRKREREESYSAACCATVGTVPATVARRMSRGCDWS